MNWFKRDPLISAVVLASIAMIGAESALLFRATQEARRAVVAFGQKQRERDDLQRQSPVPTKENEQAIQLELAAAGERFAAARAILARDSAGDSSAAVAAPAKSIDAYFDIASFVDKTRALAAQTKVTIRSDEHFGFGSYAREGPDAELLNSVFRQRIALQFLVNALFESHPAALISIQREHPLTRAQLSERTQRNQALSSSTETAKASGKNDEPADFFDFAGTSSLRVPGEIDTDAFRVEFSGQTGVLRTFLNRLAVCRQPFVVRSVETEPLISSPANHTNASPSGGAAMPVPIVGQIISRFRIVVELVTALGETERPES